MTVVVGTAGHIDHGKTTLLRALTGIDADRLPEERRRGMTIDVGYAHLDLPDGTAIDFVDVPGHDKLVGNMLVGAGEIDAALLVVAADDGPRPRPSSTSSCSMRSGSPRRRGRDEDRRGRRSSGVEVVRSEVATLLAATTLAGAPVLAASGSTGDGVDVLRDALVAACRPACRLPAAVADRLAIDRVFCVKGRGVVVTGTLRGGPASPRRRRCGSSRATARRGSARSRSTGRRSTRSRPAVERR